MPELPDQRTGTGAVTKPATWRHFLLLYHQTHPARNTCVHPWKHPVLAMEAVCSSAEPGLDVSSILGLSLGQGLQDGPSTDRQTDTPPSPTTVPAAAGAWGTTRAGSPGAPRGWGSLGRPGEGRDLGRILGVTGAPAAPWGPFGPGAPWAWGCHSALAAALGVVQELNLEENQEPPFGNTPRAGRSRGPGGLRGRVLQSLRRAEDGAGGQTDTGAVFAPWKEGKKENQPMAPCPAMEPAPLLLLLLVSPWGCSGECWGAESRPHPQPPCHLRLFALPGVPSLLPGQVPRPIADQPCPPGRWDGAHTTPKCDRLFLSKWETGAQFLVFVPFPKPRGFLLPPCRPSR